MRGGRGGNHVVEHCTWTVEREVIRGPHGGGDLGVSFMAMKEEVNAGCRDPG